MNYRIKLVLFVLGGLAVLFVIDTAYQALNTLARLRSVEAGRDSWQRPSDVIGALSLKPGNVVVDLGCGSGYFTLKLSSTVGDKGKVIAEDIRGLPLVFLWFRTLGRTQRNVTIVHGASEDPHLPEVGVDAVLIANTYHEFTDPQSILAHVRQSLVPGGRLVVVDRHPKSTVLGPQGAAAEHEVSPDQVQLELRQAAFEIVRRQDHFIESDPFRESWWLIVARKQ